MFIASLLLLMTPSYKMILFQKMLGDAIHLYKIKSFIPIKFSCPTLSKKKLNVKIVLVNKINELTLRHKIAVYCNAIKNILKSL